MAGAESGGREQGVWQELRNRRVTRTVLTYLCAAFAVLEAVLAVAPKLGLEFGIVRVVMGAMVLGFPFAVVMAWTYDITPKGIVRTPDHAPPGASSQSGPRLRRFSWLLLCAGAIALGLAFRALRAAG